MRPLSVISLTSAALAGAAVAAPAPQESWGKAGVSLDQYRQDALECGLQGHYTDISKTEDAKEFVRASRQLDTMTTSTYAPNTTSAGGTGPVGTDTVDQMARYAANQQHVIQGSQVHRHLETWTAAVTQQTHHDCCCPPVQSCQQHHNYPESMLQV